MQRKISVKFSVDNKIDFYEPIARDYFERVLKYPYDKCILTDLSSVCHFVGDNLEEGSPYKKVVDLTLSEYDVDLTEIPDQLFVLLFERIWGQMLMKWHL